MKSPTQSDTSGAVVTTQGIENSTVTQDINSELRKMLGGDFIYLKHIGAGMFGNVYLCKYSGNDEQIRSLCVRGPDSKDYISVKILFEQHKIKHEADIAHDLFQNRASDESLPRYTVGVPLKQGDVTIALIMPYYSYKTNSQGKPQESSLAAYLKNFYANVVSGSVHNKNPSDPMHSAFYKDYGIMQAQLINEMQEIVFGLHSKGYLHLDTASRNFVLIPPDTDRGNIIQLRLILCDYGHTAKMSDGIVKTDKGKKPLAARDNQDIEKNIATVKTDIFALKCAVLGMISMSLSNLMHDNKVLNIGVDTPEEFIQKRIDNNSYFRNDITVLTAYLHNLSRYLNGCPDHNIKTQAELLIKVYRKYIATMPPKDMSPDEADQFDQKLLLTCNANYFEALIKSKAEAMRHINSKETLQPFLLSRSRLMKIPLPDDFKKTEFYREFIAIDTIEKVRAFIKKFKPKEDHYKQQYKKLAADSEESKWVTKLDDAKEKWKQEHGAVEVTWAVRNFEKHVDRIKKRIIDGVIKSSDQVEDQLQNVIQLLNFKIAQKLSPHPLKFRKKEATQETAEDTYIKPVVPEDEHIVVDADKEPKPQK